MPILRSRERGGGAGPTAGLGSPARSRSEDGATDSDKCYFPLAVASADGAHDTLVDLDMLAKALIAELHADYLIIH